jgi:hypothetical protein
MNCPIPLWNLFNGKFTCFIEKSLKMLQVLLKHTLENKTLHVYSTETSTLENEIIKIIYILLKLAAREKNITCMYY